MIATFDGSEYEVLINHDKVPVIRQRAGKGPIVDDSRLKSMVLLEVFKPMRTELESLRETLRKTAIGEDLGLLAQLSTALGETAKT